MTQNVTSIGYNAFEGCSCLTDVFCYAENVLETKANAFDYSNIANATLHVPSGSVETYSVAEPWSGFKEIVAIRGGTNIDRVLDSKSCENCFYYNLSGQRVDNPTKGLYIKNGRKIVIQ